MHEAPLIINLDASKTGQIRDVPTSIIKNEYWYILSDVVYRNINKCTSSILPNLKYTL